MDIEEIIARAAYNDEWRHPTKDEAWERLADTLTGDEVRGHWLAQARAIRNDLGAAGYDIVKHQKTHHEILGDQRIGRERTNGR